MDTARRKSLITIFANQNMQYGRKVDLNNLLHHFCHMMRQLGRSPLVQTFLPAPETLSAGQLILLNLRNSVLRWCNGALSFLKHSEQK